MNVLLLKLRKNKREISFNDFPSDVKDSRFINLESSKQHPDGAAILTRNRDTLKVQRCCFFNNRATEGYGGAIYFQGHTLFMSLTCFKDCEAIQGTAFYSVTMAKEGMQTIESVSVTEHNHTTSTDVIFIDYGTQIIKKCNSSNNIILKGSIFTIGDSASAVVTYNNGVNNKLSSKDMPDTYGISAIGSKNAEIAFSNFINNTDCDDQKERSSLVFGESKSVTDSLQMYTCVIQNNRFKTGLFAANFADVFRVYFCHVHGNEGDDKYNNVNYKEYRTGPHNGFTHNGTIQMIKSEECLLIDEFYAETVPFTPSDIFTASHSFTASDSPVPTRASLSATLTVVPIYTNSLTLTNDGSIIVVTSISYMPSYTYTWITPNYSQPLPGGNAEEGITIWAIIIIVASAALILAAITFLSLYLYKKKQARTRRAARENQKAEANGEMPAPDSTEEGLSQDTDAIDEYSDHNDIVN